MYPWNTTLPPPPSTVTGRLQPPASTSTSSPAHTSHQMSSMQWRPSMTSRSSTQGPLAGLHMNQGSATASSPAPGSTTASPFRPMSLSRPRSNHEMPPVSVVIESRPQPRIDSLDSSDSERSVSGTGGAATTTRGATTGRNSSGDDRDGNNHNNLGGRRGRTDRDARDDDAIMIVDDEPDGSGGIMGGADSSSSTVATHTNNTAANQTNANSAARRHGKRLTTLEEVSLFDICNRHAADFGHRSSLCKWWMTVTEEFTRDQGHPYSWHSVRRKVEIVTKQRQKFLEEQRQQRDPPPDSANPRWRVAVDAWIPTWQRWEEAEARRIEKRDMRRPRKRKYWEASSPWDVISSMSCDSGGWKPPPPPPPPPPAPVPSLPAGNVNRSGESPSSTVPSATTAATPAGGDTSSSRTQQNGLTPTPAPSSSHTSSTPTAVRLPPGFDTMFQATSPATPVQHTTPTAPTPSMDAGVMSAMLETLGKLNKHLDAAANPTAPTDIPRAPQLQLPSPLPPSTTSSTSSAASAASAASLPSSTPSSEREPGSPRPSAPQNNPNPNPNPHTNNTNNKNKNKHTSLSPATIAQLKEELRLEMREEIHRELEKDRAALEEKLDAVQRTQDMILEMLRQEPA